MNRTLFAIAFALSCTRAASAQSMFRGNPAHTGVYTGGGPVLQGLAWRAATDGDVVSSPTVDGQTVYVGSDDGHLYALDLTTGTRRWRTDLGSPVSSTPAVGGGLVFAAGYDGKVFALDAKTGAKRWSVPTGKLKLFPWGHESGDYYVSSTAYVAGTVVIGAGDGAVLALNALTGAVKWRAQTGGRVRSSPAVSNGRVYVGSFDGVVYCFNLASGAKVWSHETEGTQLFSGNFGYDRRSVQSSPAVMNGTVYVGARDGFVYALDAATGERRWRFDHHISWINSSPAVADGVIYDGSSDAHFLQAVDTTGKELWRSTVDALVWSSPAVAGDVIYFGDGQGRLRAVDKATGVERWVFRPGGQTYSSPVVAGDLVIVGNSDGNVYALRANAGPEVKRAVFFDSTALSKGHVPQPLQTARNFTARGYTLLDTASVVTFLSDRIADKAPSVVVFALDYLPQALVGEKPDSSVFRRYLEAGGKVVWTGPPPRLFPLTPTPGKIVIDWPTASGLTNVPQDSSLFDNRGVRATAEGSRWGLKPRWRDAWSVAPAGVTQVLGMDEWGLAAAYVKSFGGPKGTGFVRVPPDDPVVIYLAAETRGG